MKNYRIDNLQYCNWSKKIFKINNDAKLDAVHVTIAYHEDFNDVKKNVETWSKHFKENKDLIFHGKNFKDIEKHIRKRKQQYFSDFKIALLSRMILILLKKAMNMVVDSCN